MSKEEKYKEIIEKLGDFFVNYVPGLDSVGVMATLSSVVKSQFSSLIFVGFYVTRHVNGEPVLEIGPYQGDVLACGRIEFGDGVCGTAAKLKQTLVVPNVHEFEGYIACDGETKSEIVVPVIKNNEVIAVFDVDHGEIGYFDDTDKFWLERLASYIN